MTPSSPSARRAQVSTIDFIAGLTIITIALLIASNLLIGANSNDQYQTVKREATTAARRLMSPGYPHDWNQTTMLKTGITTDDKLNTTKLDKAAQLPYQDLKEGLGVTTHVYWYLTNATAIQNISGCGHGDPTVTVQPDCQPDLPDHRNLVRIDRFLAHDDNILRLVILAWD